MSRFPKHVQWLLDNYADDLTHTLQKNAVMLSATAAMDIIMAADPDQKKSCVDWLVKAYCTGGYLWEDIEAGSESKVCSTLKLFIQHKNKLDENQRHLNKYTTLAKIFIQVKEFARVAVDHSPSARAQKRQLREKALEESIIVHRCEDMIAAVPLTIFSSQWWGRGTRWCTAAVNNNYFHHYNKDAPLIVLTFPKSIQQEITRDKLGVEKAIKRSINKLQLHVGDKEISFMDEDDDPVEISLIQSYWSILQPVIDWAFDINPAIIQWIPNEHLTQEICKKAFNSNPKNIKWITPNYIDEQMCCFIKKSKKDLILYLPVERLEEQDCLDFIDNKTYMNLEDIPISLRTKNVCKQALKYNKENFHFCPPDILDSNFLDEVVEKNGDILEYIPDSLKTMERCRLAVMSYGKDALIWIPKEYITQEICNLALENSCGSKSFSIIPEEFLTLETCKAYVRKNITIDGVPDKFLVPELISEIKDNILCGLILSFKHKDKIPAQVFTDDIMLKCFKRYPGIIRYVRDNILTKEIVLDALKSEKYISLGDIPKNLINKEICIAIVKSNSHSVINLPEEYQNKSVYQEIIDQNKDVIQYLDSKALNILGLEIQPQERNWNETSIIGLKEKIQENSNENKIEMQM